MTPSARLGVLPFSDTDGSFSIDADNPKAVNDHGPVPRYQYPDSVARVGLKLKYSLRLHAVMSNEEPDRKDRLGEEIQDPKSDDLCVDAHPA